MSYSFADSLLLASCQQNCMTYTGAVCTVKKTPDDGQRNCLKYADYLFRKEIWEIRASSWFYYKNAFLDLKGIIETS